MISIEMLLSALAVAVVGLAGCGLQRLISPRREISAMGERMGLAWILGAGWISLLIATLGPWLHRGTLCLTLTGLTAAMAAFAWHRSKGTRITSVSLRKWDWVFVGIIIAQAVIIGWAATKLALRWDAMTTWEWKARLAFASGGSLPGSYFQDPAYEWSHSRYPLQLPYLGSWLYLCLGQADQSWFRIIGPIYYMAGVSVLIGACNRLGAGRITAWCAGAGMFFVPYAFVGMWGMFSGYADLPTGVILIAAISRIPSLQRTEEAHFLGIIAALLPWMKREGTYLWLIVVLLAAIQLIRTQRTRDLAWIIAPGALVIGGFAFAMHQVGALPQSGVLKIPLQDWATRIERIDTIATHLGRKVFDFESWSLLWPGSILATITLLLRRKFSLAVTLGGGLAACWLLLGSAYVFEYPIDFESHIPTTIDRILLQFVPLGVLTIAMAVPRQSAKNEMNACLGSNSTLSGKPRVCPDTPISDEPKEINPS